MLACAWCAVEGKAEVLPCTAKVLVKACKLGKGKKMAPSPGPMKKKRMRTPKPSPKKKMRKMTPTPKGMKKGGKGEMPMESAEEEM